MKGKSKFDSAVFEHDGLKVVAVNAQKYSKTQASDICKRILGFIPKHITTAAVSWQATTNEFSERHVGWSLNLLKDGTEPRFCPVWVFTMS